MMKGLFRMTLVLLSFLFLFSVQGAQDLTIGNYSLVSRERIGRTEFNYTYRADVTNTGPAVRNVTATVKSTSAHTVVVDGTLTFGDVPAGGTVTSNDTFPQRDSGDVSVLLGVGDGTFQTPQRFAVGGSPESVVVGDLNRDGISDIVTANDGSRDVSVLLGVGDGTFQAEQRFAVGIRPFSVSVADLNGDGAPDLVTTGSGGISVLLHR